MKYAVLLYFSLLLAFTNFAQQFNFRTYSLEEGLSRSGVYYMLQDKNGFLWIGTEDGGVCKFDGFTMQNFSRQDGLPSANVRVIFEDHQGLLWFGTDEGLAYFDKDHFHSISAEEGLPSDFVRTLAQDNAGNLWVGTSFGIALVDVEHKKLLPNPKINQQLPDKKVRSILIDSNKVWIATNGGLCLYQDSTLKVFTEAEGLVNNIAISLFKDNQQNLWIGTREGVSKFKAGEFTSWTMDDGLVNGRIRSINQDDYGNIWLGTREGVSVFNGYEFTNYTSKNGMSNERIRCIQKDNFGNMWLGSFYGGIMKYNFQDFIAFTPKEGLISNQIISITEDEKGDIIVGSYDGVSKLKIKNNKLESVKQITRANGLINNRVKAVIKDDNGYYWYGTGFGISILKDGAAPIYVNKLDGLIDDRINEIKLINGVFWVGTAKGIALVKPSANYQSFEIKNYEDLSGENVTAIEQGPKGNIWITFSDGGLTVFDNNKTFFTPQLDTNLTEINSVAFDEANRIWIGTNGYGVFYGDIPADLSKETLQLEVINAQQHLSSDYVFSLLYYNRSIWVGHEKGLDLIDFKSDSSFLIQSFGPEKGFLGLQNNLNASFKDSQNNLWFGTINGLYFLNNQEVEKIHQGQASICYIKNVVVDNLNQGWDKSLYNQGVEGVFALPKDLVLPYHLNNIAFEFVALNYIAPENIKYSWKLMGYDKTWHSMTEKDNIAYTNLDPGNYEFQLKSTNEKGELEEDVQRFEFVILPPYWQSWWFRILAIVGILVLVLFLLNIRTKQLRKKQKILEHLIDKRTKEVVAQKEVLEHKQKEIEHQNEELQLKNKEITDSIQYSKRIQRSILPSKEKVNMLLSDYFIFYKPKDIVSGDFYWIEKHPDNEKKVFFAAADCTGHGVPGAMVSMISTRALNSSLLEHQYDQPSTILDKTNEIVREAFTDFETGTIIKDGMDISLGALNYSDENNIHFKFAGAQNSAWIIIPKEEPNLVVNEVVLEPNIESETHKLFEIKANKQPIGHFDNIVPFNNYMCSVKRGYKIYLFSDGFADQFGGEKGKKYKYKKFKKFLLSIQKHNIERQKLDVEQEFYKWKGDFEQLDDICVIGVSV